MTPRTPMTPPTPACCEEYAGLTRRGLFRGAALAGATTVLGSAVVTTAAAAPSEADAVLVVLSLRGAADGLSLVVPHADPVYYAARPRIAVPAERLLARDATFGLHPELAPLLPLWQAGRLAAVHGTGLPAPNRSHFAAMEELEDADPGSAARRGWLNRLIGADGRDSPLQGFSLGGGVLPTSLYGDDPALSATDVASVGIAGDDEWDPKDLRRRSLHTLWDRSTGPMGKAMRSMFAAVDGFAPVQGTADHRDRYPQGDLGAAMASAARVVRGNVGVSVITVDHGDWDMHSDLGTLEWGGMRSNAAELASAVAAFFTDLGDQAGKVTLVALSEFGRRVRENASYGLDHGYGNVMLVAGAGVRGGRYYGTMPPLTGDEDSDVPVTTDYRSVLSEIATTRFGVSTAAVFPGFRPEPVGVMTSL